MIIIEGMGTELVKCLADLPFRFQNRSIGKILCNAEHGALPSILDHLRHCGFLELNNRLQAYSTSFIQV
jgi:hypothetical protein